MEAKKSLERTVVTKKCDYCDKVINAFGIKHLLAIMKTHVMFKHPTNKKIK